VEIAYSDDPRHLLGGSQARKCEREDKSNAEVPQEACCTLEHRGSVALSGGLGNCAF
jgi:hypothetical protein